MSSPYAGIPAGKPSLRWRPVWIFSIVLGVILCIVAMFGIQNLLFTYHEADVSTIVREANTELTPIIDGLYDDYVYTLPRRNPYTPKRAVTAAILSAIANSGFQPFATGVTDDENQPFNDYSVMLSAYNPVHNDAGARKLMYDIEVTQNFRRALDIYAEYDQKYRDAMAELSPDKDYDDQLRFTSNLEVNTGLSSILVRQGNNAWDLAYKRPLSYVLMVMNYGCDPPPKSFPPNHRLTITLPNSPPADDYPPMNFRTCNPPR